MGVKISGMAELMQRLDTILERSSEGARQALEDGAKKIQKQAQMYAPVDLHNLEKAIKIDSDRGGIRRRKRFFVYVDTNLPVPQVDGKTVGDYAFIMHEGVYDLGEKSKEKAALLGVAVGRKFLERAAKELEEEIALQVALGAKKRIGK
jgi:hypothetical protein